MDKFPIFLKFLEHLSSSAVLEGCFSLKYIMTHCAILYHLYYLKNVKNTHGEVLLLVKPATLLKITLLHGCFSRF